MTYTDLQAAFNIRLDKPMVDARRGALPGTAPSQLLAVCFSSCQ